MDTTDLLLHPVRLRIIHALYGQRVLTTSEICAELPDVSRATVYRHVAHLADAGVLEVHSEHRERGIIERRYQLQSARAVIEADAAKVFTVEDHRRAVTAVVGALLTEFDNYLQKDANDKDFVGYPQLSLWLTGEELQTMIKEFRAAVRSRTANRPGEGRRRYLLTSVLFPSGEAPSASG